MSYDGNGAYTPPAPQYPAIPGTPILAEDFNDIISDIAQALSLVLVRDGQAPMTGDLDLGTKNLKNGKLASTITATTLPVGTNTDQVATAAMIVAAAFAAALPAQAGVKASRVVNTNGSGTAFWGMPRNPMSRINSYKTLSG